MALPDTGSIAVTGSLPIELGLSADMSPVFHVLPPSNVV